MNEEEEEEEDNKESVRSCCVGLVTTIIRL